MQSSTKATVQFAGSLFANIRAYQVVVTYKDEVYYSDRLPKSDAVELTHDIHPGTVKKFIDRGVIVAG